MPVSEFVEYLPSTITVFFLLTFLVLWIQVTLFHYRGQWRKAQMWFPVLWSPLTIIVGFITLGARGLAVAYLALLAVAALGGLMGALYHLLGVYRLPGGLTLNNVLQGPPIFLPLTYTALSVVGLLAAYGLYLG